MGLRVGLHSWWKRAWSNLGIEGIDLYGFDRYFQIEMEDVRGIYRDTTGDTKKGAGHQT
jgi:hypothetical protein